jgi:hypothetical protein
MTQHRLQKILRNYSHVFLTHIPICLHRIHTPLFLQEKKDNSAEMRWKYGDQLDYLAGLSTYAKLPNMKLILP